MSRTDRALRSTVVVSGFGYTAQALSLIAIPLFLGTVGAEGYGLMVTVMSFMGYLSFADAGLSWGSMILIAQAQGRGGKAEIAHIVRHSAVLAAGSGLLMAGVLAAVWFAAGAGWRLPMFAHHPESDRLIVIAGLQLALGLQFGVVYNLFQGLQEGYWTGLYSGLSRLSGLGAAMATAHLTHRVDAMMGAQLLCSLFFGGAATVHAWRKHPWAFQPGPWTDRAQFGEQVRIGAKNFLFQIGRTLGGTAPTLGISAILGPAAVPLYTVPTTLLSLCFMPINTWNTSLQSAYGEAWVAGSRGWVRDTFRRSLERSLAFGGLGVGLFLALGDDFIRIWTHTRLRLDPGTAVSIAAIALLGAFLAASQFLLTGLNRHRVAALAEVASGALAIALVAAAVRAFGLGGVGLGVVGAALATSVWVVVREIGRQVGPGCFPDLIQFAKSGLAGTAAAAVALGIRRALGGEGPADVIGLVLAGIAGTAFYLAVAVALGLVAVGEVWALGRRLTGRMPSLPS